MISILNAQNNKTRFFYVFYTEKRWVFDQSERAQGPVYIIIKDIAHNAHDLSYDILYLNTHLFQ